MLKKFFCVFFLILPLFCAFSLPAMGYTPSDFEVNAKSAYMFNPETGDVLYEKDPDARCYPAALTNIMTAALLCEAKSDLSEVFTVPEEAYTSLLGTGAAVMELSPGETLSAEDLLYAIMLNSAPDAAITVACGVAGSVPAFVDMMNAKAKELGMTGTRYYNVTGLHDLGHYTTARDVGTLCAWALKFPEIEEAASERRHTIPPTNLHGRRVLSTTNYLLDANTGYSYRYATGLKTGYTDEAGRCLAATARYEGDVYVAVLMGESDEAGRAEFTDAAALFKWGFTGFGRKVVVSSDAPVGEAAVELSWDTDHVTLYPAEDFSALVPVDADSSTVTVRCELPRETLDAPVKKGEKVGVGHIMYAGSELGTVDLVAGEDVRKNVFLQIARAVRRAVTSVAFRVILLVLALAVLGFVISVVYLNRGKRRRRKW